MRFTIDISISDDVTAEEVADWLLDHLCALDDDECPKGVQSFDGTDWDHRDEAERQEVIRRMTEPGGEG